MELRVEFDELDYVTKTMERDKEELQTEVNRLKDSLERVRNVWSGPDFEQFYEKASPYVNRMQVLVDFLDASSSFITNSCDQYQFQDEYFSRDLDKEREEEIPNEQGNY